MARRPSKNFFFAKLLRYDTTSQKYTFNTSEDKFDDRITSISSTTDESNVLPTGWTFKKTVANELLIIYNGTAVAKIAPNGEIISIDDVTAYGTM